MAMYEEQQGPARPTPPDTEDGKNLAGAAQQLADAARKCMQLAKTDEGTVYACTKSGNHVAAGDPWHNLTPLGPLLTDVTGIFTGELPQGQEENPADFVRCGRCLVAFDPADKRWNGKAQQRDEPYCRECQDRCHDTEIADHSCPVCNPGPANIPLRAKVDGKWDNVMLTRTAWNATRAAASR